jgi:hypothetical protein
LFGFHTGGFEMLPDYPEIKNRIKNLMHARIRKAQEVNLGVFNQVKELILHEGDRILLIREDGSEDEIWPKSVEFTVTRRWDLREIDKITPGEIIGVFDSVGEGMATEKGKQIVQVIEEACTKTGNVINQNKTLLERFFESHEKILMDFHDNGTPIFPTLVAGSQETVDKLQQVLDEIQSTPELLQRWNKLLDKKRAEWNDREASRNLVD